MEIVMHCRVDQNETNRIFIVVQSRVLLGVELT